MIPPEVIIGDVAGWAYDMYSREGRAALAKYALNAALAELKGQGIEHMLSNATWLIAHLFSAPQKKHSQL
jgi:hypothetical protein